MGLHWQLELTDILVSVLLELLKDIGGTLASLSLGMGVVPAPFVVPSSPRNGCRIPVIIAGTSSAAS